MVFTRCFVLLTLPGWHRPDTELTTASQHVMSEKRAWTYALFTRDTFTWGKLTFLLYCVTFCYCEMHLPHVNVSRVNTALESKAIFRDYNLSQWTPKSEKTYYTGSTSLFTLHPTSIQNLRNVYVNSNISKYVLAYFYILARMRDTCPCWRKIAPVCKCWAEINLKMFLIC